MNSFIQKDGMRNMFDEEGVQFVEMKMEVDEINYPLDDVTNFDQYSDLKPPKKMQQDKKEVPEEELSSSKKKANSKKTYRKYKKEDMERFFYFINEKRMSIRGAAAEIKVPSSTAYNWHKKGLESLELDEDIEKGGARSAVKMGRPALLNDIHKGYLISLVEEKPSIVLDEMMGSLTTEFADLKISKSSLHEFVTEKRRISLKRAHFHSIERSSPQKIEERYQWVKQWEKTDLDFETLYGMVKESRTYHCRNAKYKSKDYYHHWIKIAENRRDESFCDVGATGDANLDDVDDIGAVKVDDIGDVNTTEVGDVSTAGASSTIAIEEHNTGFEEQLKRLDPAKKWPLSTGECVDNCYFYLDYKANMIILVDHT